MGKKRNNAAKKKQAAKKKRLSSAYGVSVLKGGTIARNNGVIDANNPTSIANNNSTKKLEKNNKPTTAQNDGNDHSMELSAQDIPSKRPRNNQSENDEFQRLHASLEERSLASQARKEEQRKTKKGNRKHQKKGWGSKFARPSTTSFAPATLTLAPKSTQELVDDAANQVAQGMNDIGQRAATNQADGSQAIPGQSSLAAAASMSWKLRVSSVNNNQKEEPPNQNNPYAALDVDSDSDNEWAEKKEKVVLQFQFKPASFSFQPTVPDPAARAAVADDDVDPDL